MTLTFCHGIRTFIEPICVEMPSGEVVKERIVVLARRKSQKGINAKHAIPCIRPMRKSLRENVRANTALLVKKMATSPTA
jgi:hypothetical protein